LTDHEKEVGADPQFRIGTDCDHEICLPAPRRRRSPPAARRSPQQLVARRLPMGEIKFETADNSIGPAQAIGWSPG
jgi:hypothetical protein